MQIREIRWISDGGEEDKRQGRIPLGPGITILEGGGPSFPGLDSWALQADLLLGPGSTLPYLATGPSSIWCLLLSHEDRSLTYASDQEASGRQTFFRHAVLGGEAELLGGAVDYALLADPRIPHQEKTGHLRRLYSDLEEAGRQSLEGARSGGSLRELEADLRACELDMEGQSQAALLPHRLLAAIEEGEKDIQAMRAEDGDLAHQQQQETYLAIKVEYETLLRLRDDLQETEAREGAYGSRITDMGHNITVHELTELTRMRNEARQLEEAMGRAGQALEDTRRERLKAEQERAFLGRQLQELEAQRLEELQGLAHKEAIQEKAPEPAREAFPSRRQLLWLALALALVAGLFLAIFYSPLAYILVGLALLAGLALALGSRSRPRPPSEVALPAEKRERPLGALLLERSSDLDQTMKRIDDLDQEEAKYTVEYEKLGRQFRRQENDLLRLLRSYAGPSETGEIDDILLTLSRQRDSSAYFNETVSDLLRQIAELKHGRSEEEMLKEYDKACAMLYGIPDGSGLSGQYLTRQLTHDPQRARQIHDERVSLAGRLDQRVGEVANLKEKLKQARESTVNLASLEQRQAVLRQSLEERAEDYRQNRLAAAWLETLLEEIDQIDYRAWMDLTLAYLGRLTGRRPVAGLTLPLPQLAQGKMRPPRIGGTAKKPDILASADPSLFGLAPRVFSYLAARLALSAMPGQSAWTQVPLICLEPPLPDASSQREYLLDSLEEWALGTGKQLVYFTTDDQLISLARERRMTRSISG